MRNYLALKQKDNEAELYIYGDITSEKYAETDVSASDIIQQLNEITASNITVYINSYGGEVGEGIAIYNALKRSKAKVTTVCDAFACSIASCIFMAGDTRQMYENSLLMVHNVFTRAEGNAAQLKKEAEDLETINQTIKNIYLKSVNISDEELQMLLDEESWVSADKALSMGFATDIIDEEPITKARASAFKTIRNKLLNADKSDKDDNIKVQQMLNSIVEKVEKLEEAVFQEDEDENNANNEMNNFLNIFMK